MVFDPFLFQQTIAISIKDILIQYLQWNAILNLKKSHTRNNLYFVLISSVTSTPVDTFQT